MLQHPRWPKGRQVLDPRTLSSQSLSQVKITVPGSQGSCSKTRFTTHPARRNRCKKLHCNFGWTCASHHADLVLSRHGSLVHARHDDEGHVMRHDFPPHVAFEIEVSKVWQMTVGDSKCLHSSYDSPNQGALAVTHVHI